MSQFPAEPQAGTAVGATPPDANLAQIAEDSPHAYATGNTVYYGPGSGSFEVRASASDATSGLDRAEHPATVSAGGVYTQALGGAYQYAHTCTFTSSSAEEGTYQATVYDRAGNFTGAPFTVTRDTAPPLVTVTAGGAPTVTVEWSADDPSSSFALASRSAGDFNKIFMPPGLTCGNMNSGKKAFGRRSLMNTLPPTEIASLLQKGIAAARTGRSQAARQFLHQVVKTDPNNEMGWLWLSGLMATNEQKHACLEQVLRVNPENVYARAGLERLQRISPPVTSPVKVDVLEARLASVAGGSAPPNGTRRTAKPAIKKLTSSPSLTRPATEQSRETRAAVKPMEPTQSSAHTPPSTDPIPDPDSLETTCPACDGPVLLADSRCPHCYMPFNFLGGQLFEIMQTAS